MERFNQFDYKYEGSLGSRLHKLNDQEYIAYAQWPNQNIFDNAGNNLPNEANSIRKKMKEACSSIQTVYKMEMVENLLTNTTK